ncbi:MAG: HAD family hydrolase [Chloroflexi bacterium]|nr:HAD family hydrolase [Chloroflexota bacterium]
MSLRGVIFDMGGTLLHYRPPGGGWDDMEKLGAAGVYGVLRDLGHTLPPEVDALNTAWDFMLDIWRNLDGHAMQDLKLHRILTRLAAHWGVNGLTTEQVDNLALAYTTAIQAGVRPLDGAEDTLRALRERGLRVGLISNTHWPGEIHQRDLDRHSLTPHLEYQVFSADVEAWKPHAEIFHLALDALELQPEEAAYVGDSLYFDVWGAQQAGIRGVWIEQPRRFLPEGFDEVTPDATLPTLPDLIAHVDRWRSA